MTKDNSNDHWNNPNINIPKFKATMQEVYRELVLISSKKFYALIVDRRKLYEDYV